MRAAMVLFTLLFITSVAAREHRFLHIDNPVDRSQYAETAGMAIVGYLYLPGRVNDAKSFRVEVTLYRPAGKKFAVEQKVTAEVRAKPEEPGVYTFIARMKGQPAFPPSDYLVRVNCRDKAAESSPIIATQSVFIEVTASEAVSQQVANNRHKH